MTRSNPGYPNLFVLGAMKAGTSSVHYVLAGHPEIYMSPVKEPKHFAFCRDDRPFTGPRDPSNEREWVPLNRYLSLFTERGDRKYAGESSTVYLYHPDAVRNIREAVPDARLIALLRHPVDRAYSNFAYCRQRGLEPESSFQRALELEEERISRGWGPAFHYKARGLYGLQLERCLRFFPRDQLHVGFYDELKTDPERFYERILQFLEVSVEVRLDTALVKNRTSAVRSPLVERILETPRLVPGPLREKLRQSRLGRWLHSRLLRLRQLNGRPVDPMPPQSRVYLEEYYRPDLLRLERVLETTLDRWRKPA